MIKLDNISFKYDNQLVVSELSYEFSENTSSAITGASGSGKTTLLYLLSGLLKPQSGKVINDKKTAVIFQEDRLFPWLSVLENITVAGASADRATELLKKLFPFEDVSEKYPNELSGGMKQRVSIARALSIYPELLIMDEPFKGLDAETRKITADTVFEEMHDKTCILITHDSIDISYCQKHLHISDTPVKKLEEI